MKQSGTGMTLPKALKTPVAHPSVCVLYLISGGLIYGSIPCHGTSYVVCGCGWLLTIIARVCVVLRGLIYGLILP